MIKKGYFVIRNIGDFLEDMFDIRKSEKPQGLRIGTEYLITREVEGKKIITRLWNRRDEKDWQEEVRAHNPYYIAKAILEKAIKDGGTYYEITNDRFTKMEGRE